MEAFTYIHGGSIDMNQIICSLIIVMIILSALDAILTEVVISHYDVKESNPLFSDKPKLWKVVLFKVCMNIFIVCAIGLLPILIATYLLCFINGINCNAVITNIFVWLKERR